MIATDVALEASPPNPVVLAEQVALLRALWLELGDYLTRRDAAKGPKTGGADYVSGSAAPGNLTVIDARFAIDHRAFEWAKELIDGGSWFPPRAATTPDLLEAIAGRVGHWTGDDHPDAGETFAAEINAALKVAETAAHPNHARRIPLQVPCAEVECPGWYTVALPEWEDDTEQLPERARIRRWLDTRPRAVCDEVRSHNVDAQIAANWRDDEEEAA